MCERKSVCVCVVGVCEREKERLLFFCVSYLLFVCFFLLWKERMFLVLICLLFVLSDVSTAMHLASPTLIIQPCI